MLVNEGNGFMLKEYCQVSNRENKLCTAKTIHGNPVSKNKKQIG